MTTGPLSANSAGISVGELLASTVFEACEVAEVGGEGALQQQVLGVTITAPPFAEFARRGEIVMCTGEDVRAEEPEPVHDQLRSIGVAAMVLSFEDPEQEQYWRQGWPTAASIPLLIYPWHHRFADLARAIDDAVALAHEQDGLFVNMVHEGRGMQELLDALERAISAPVLLLDHAGYPVGRGQTVHGYDDATFSLLVASSGPAVPLPRANTPEEYSPRTGPLPAGALVGIAARQDPYAYLHAGLDTALTRATRQRLIDAASAIAIESLRHRSSRQNERLLAEAALWSLIRSPSPATAEDDYRRLIGWGLTPTRTYFIAAAAATGSADAGQVDEAVREIRNLCLARHQGSLVASRGEQVVLVVPSPAEVRADDDIVKATRDVMAWGTTGDAVDVRAMPGAARTALRTARAALLRNCLGTMSTTAQVRPWLMLVDVADNEEAQEQARGIIAALKSAAGDLVHTVEVLLDENCNVSAAARRLYLNRHSLLYRIERIEHLTSTSFNSPADRLLLQLCLIIHASLREPTHD